MAAEDLIIPIRPHLPSANPSTAAIAIANVFPCKGMSKAIVTSSSTSFEARIHPSPYDATTSLLGHSAQSCSFSGWTTTTCTSSTRTKALGTLSINMPFSFRKCCSASKSSPSLSPIAFSPTNNGYISFPPPPEEKRKKSKTCCLRLKSALARFSAFYATRTMKWSTEWSHKRNLKNAVQPEMSSAIASGRLLDIAGSTDAILPVDMPVKQARGGRTDKEKSRRDPRVVKRGSTMEEVMLLPIVAEEEEEEEDEEDIVDIHEDEELLVKV